jgi:hypothetical protein
MTILGTSTFGADDKFTVLVAFISHEYIEFKWRSYPP